MNDFELKHGGRYVKNLKLNDNLDDFYDKTFVDHELSHRSKNPVQNKAVTNALDGKVDKIEGMGLSKNDFTDELKSKLDGIEEGADKTIVDEELSEESENPVQNKILFAKLKDLEERLANLEVLAEAAWKDATIEVENLDSVNETETDRFNLETK